MIYIPKFFKVQELVDKSTFEHPTVGGNTALRYFRPDILRALDWMREFYPTTDGKRALTVNDWHIGGSHEWRGLRLPPHTLTPYSAGLATGSADWKPYSGHSWGAAVDSDAHACTPDAMRAWILEQHDKARKVAGATPLTHPVLGIRRMENGTPTWTHVDNLEHDQPGIWMVNP